MEKITRKIIELAKTAPTSDADTKAKEAYTNKLDDLEKQFKAEAIRRKSGEEMAMEMESFINCMSMDEQIEEFIQTVVHRTHRTLNQGLIGLFIKVLVEEAKLADTGRYDGRNEASVVLCKRLEPSIKDYYLPFI